MGPKTQQIDISACERFVDRKEERQVAGMQQLRVGSMYAILKETHPENSLH